MQIDHSLKVTGTANNLLHILFGILKHFERIECMGPAEGSVVSLIKRAILGSAPEEVQWKRVS